LISAMPFHHKDPFDRMIAAQAISSKSVLVSGDAIFDRYGVRRIW
jgi:PIN domain nuclease of toxin-antitoxin system